MPGRENVASAHDLLIAISCPVTRVTQQLIKPKTLISQGFYRLNKEKSYFFLCHVATDTQNPLTTRLLECSQLICNQSVAGLKL